MLQLIWAFLTDHPISVALCLFFGFRFFMGGAGGGKFEEYPGNKVIASEYCTV
jgi:hypothetical protein